MQEEQSPIKTKSDRRKEFLKKMSIEYEDRGLKEVCVDNEQIGSLHTENNREREINTSLQRDIEMLKAQLTKAEEVRARQEEEIKEQKDKIEDMHVQHQRHCGELQEHMKKEK